MWEHTVCTTTLDITQAYMIHIRVTLTITQSDVKGKVLGQNAVITPQHLRRPETDKSILKSYRKTQNRLSDLHRTGDDNQIQHILISSMLTYTGNTNLDVSRQTIKFFTAI